MKKILHVTSQFPVKSQTFVTGMIQLLSKDFKNLGLTTYLLDKDISFYESLFVSRKKISNSHNERTNISKIYVFFFKLIYKISRIIGFEQIRIKSYLTKVLPDIMIFHFGWALDEYFYLAFNSKVPVIICFYGSDATSYAFKKKSYIDKLITLSRQDNVKFTACSEFLKQKMIKLGIKEGKIFVLYNTYSTKRLDSSLKKFSQQNIFKIINIGRLVDCKGQKYLIDSFYSFQKKIKSELTLVGDGPNLEALKLYVEELGIISQVRFLGQVDHIKIPSLLNDHDVYVQPSIIYQGQEESFGVVLLEAMAANLPIIASSIGGIPEVLYNKKFTDQSYFLVNERDSVGIEYYLSKIYHGYDAELYRQYGQENLDKFSNSKYTDKLYQILKL